MGECEVKSTFSQGGKGKQSRECCFSSFGLEREVCPRGSIATKGSVCEVVLKNREERKVALAGEVSWDTKNMWGFKSSVRKKKKN